MSDAVTTIIVKGTFALLVLGSIVTWALVLLKARQRWVTRRGDARFFRALKGPLRRSALKTLDDQKGPSWRVAHAGLVALEDAERGHADADSPKEAVERALQSQIQAERRAAESGLAVLASIGTTAPFVGLFGTVWGIIHALKAIGHTGSASIEVVAGPIGEALVATGLGIAVAVPAVLAYNFYLRRLKVQTADFEQLGSAFLAGVVRGGGAMAPALRSEPIENESRGRELREARA